MFKIFGAAIVATVLAASAAQAATTTPNSAPAVSFQYGAGNDYTPADTLVLDIGNGGQLYGRWHPNSDQAAPSDANGVYSFALGTPSISFDYGFTAPTGTTTVTFAPDALVTITSLGRGGTFSYNPFLAGGNYTAQNSLQNSERLTFGFLSSVGFSPNINDTYQMTLTAGGNTLTTFARVGAGAPAVPEPATWAMLVMGFGVAGFAIRRRSSVRTSVRFA